MNINWYPGHMKKTIDSLKASLKLVDIVAELLDSRIPISSRNPLIDEILGDKPRIILMNKMDLSDKKENEKWMEYFKKEGHETVMINSMTGYGVKNIEKACRSQLREKFEKNKEKNILSDRIRLMIVGIPNVGKSTLINRLANKKSAKVGNRPGVTRHNQWIKTSGNMELLDTPGVLWPKFEDKLTGLNLAYTGAIKDEIMDVDNLAFSLIETLQKIDPKILSTRYNIKTDNKSTLEIMEEIALRRGAILKGKEIDYTKTANIVLDEFRKGILGNITLEKVEDIDVRV
ncbi:ribosome biogenesis GTPase YlqF [Miniphocaeibacter halophilus]|uniref:Ribosome biogenesis GTPase YlqF n=1 Tax=Miniphocaeibacter halophilus TaxID=2931922 RepID=A0AC61MU47_9FIRM|nr:ribosome biogenesis GTPase YlqF [Miniphocaeibacter halophilus]QQK09111.1 ribosome biogenesis GTPase YlqF [Miniphocaeibacter halophilus]